MAHVVIKSPKLIAHIVRSVQSSKLRAHNVSSVTKLMADIVRTVSKLMDPNVQAIAIMVKEVSKLMAHSVWCL